MLKFLVGVAVGWTACRFWWDETIEAADREQEFNPRDLSHEDLVEEGVNRVTDFLSSLDEDTAKSFVAWMQGRNL